MLFLFVIIVVIFVLPVAMGLVSALVLLFIRLSRFLATYAVIVPLVGACGAWLLSWGLALFLERAYQHSNSDLVFVVGFFIGGLLGSGVGVLCAFGINKLGHNLTR